MRMTDVGRYGENVGNCQGRTQVLSRHSGHRDQRREMNTTLSFERGRQVDG